MHFDDGELTMIVKTTRLSKKAIRRIQDLAILQQYLRKQQTRVTFQDALDFAITFTDENFTQVMGNMPNANIAQSSIAEIQPKNIPHEILQTASKEQDAQKSILQAEISQQTPEPQTLPTASKEQDIIGGLTKEDREKLLKQSVPKEVEVKLAKSNIINFPQDTIDAHLRLKESLKLENE